MHNEAAERLFSRAINLPISSPRLQLTPSGTAACRPSERAGRKSICYRPSLRQSQRQPSASHLPIVCATSSLCRLPLYSSSRLVAARTCQSHPACRLSVFLPLSNFVSSSRFFSAPMLRPAAPAMRDTIYTFSFPTNRAAMREKQSVGPFCKSTEKPGAPRSTASFFCQDSYALLLLLAPLP